MLLLRSEISGGNEHFFPNWRLTYLSFSDKVLAGKRERKITNICWTSISVRGSILHLLSCVLLTKILLIVSYPAHFADEESLSQRGYKTCQDPTFNNGIYMCLIMAPWRRSIVKEYRRLLYWNKSVYWVSLMFSSERGTFWWEEMNVDSSTFPLLSSDYSLIVRPLPRWWVIFSGVCVYKTNKQKTPKQQKREFQRTGVRFLNTGYNRCHSAYWLPVERVVKNSDCLPMESASV